MRYPLTNFVIAAWGVFACAIALGVLTVPASAITARALGTFTPDLCTPVCDVAINGGFPTPTVDDDYLFIISGGQTGGHRECAGRLVFGPFG
jgi:hypothetical protein